MPHIALERAVDLLDRRWGTPELLVRAPGRVNLIGEHTDYNDGFAMPMALPFDTAIALRRSNADFIQIHSEGFGDTSLRVMGDDPAVPVPTWAAYIDGAVQLLASQGISGGGWNAAIATDIPTGASLSSSAAIEVATINAVLRLADLSWPPVDVALLGQRVENEVVGLQSGIMDQLISASGVEGHAMLMDCRTLGLTAVPLPDGVVIAVLDTRTRRRLAEAAYGERRDACFRAAAAMGVAALRDATLVDLAQMPVEHVADRRRAHHVITENRRTLDAAEAMAAGDLARLGLLMNDSHRSLRDDFEVSSAALDQIVDIAQTAPGCFGARMTGGGFAGCAVALVGSDDADEFRKSVTDRYDNETGPASVWICAPAAGASVVLDDR